MTKSAAEPVFFPNPLAFRRWLAAHHATHRELRVGFYKKKSGEPSMTWPESVDEALSFGWIDGVRRTIDEIRYEIRFTPRRATSTWSAVNVARVAVLEREGRMTDAGRAAFARRQADKTGIYGHERAEPAKLTRSELATFRADARAWEDFEARAPSYRRLAIHWVVSAKREPTRARRLAKLIECCARGELIPPMSWVPPTKRAR